MSKYRESGACWQVQSVLAKLTLCRTQALGGHEFRCTNCDSTIPVYNSCGDRHCPECSGSKRFNFSERANRVFLEGITYYQVVFTLPSELSRLALANRQELAHVLFKSAWKSLHKTIRQEQAYDPAAIMVLHTWNQKLESHWHVHAIVPGAGPGTEQDTWKTSQAPPDSQLCDDQYLVDAINLRTAFRKFALAKLKRLRARGELKLDTDPEFGDLRTETGWNALMKHLASLEWVSYIQPPPPASTGPSELVRYLSRYLTGGPISDARIVSANAHEVTFLAREGKIQGGQSKQVPITLSTTEFVRRWCLHIQPDQLTKTRYFGGWSNNRLSAYLDQCVRQMEQAQVPHSPEATEFMPPSEDAGGAEPSETRTCPHCREESLIKTVSWERPSWTKLFRHDSTQIPAWYAESIKKDDETFWDERMGPGFNAWYLEYVLESAYTSADLPKASHQPARVYQPLLPGLDYWHHEAFE